MRVVVLDEAERDLDDGYWFYEHQQEGIGRYFLRQIFTDLEALPRYAGIHRVWFGKYHRMLSRRFPFGIYYTVADSEIRIHAILDMRQNPASIGRRMQEGIRRERD
ncbi:MAG: hypothetical protein FD161_328 [Limisphaerales bacterium]|nr:MAG: hypothetical protein FD161_328 [Limisphaerales bacterium]KAG0510774.1 MAG: hypothetical protein E1N63_328 [Limisphaerales bacterium]TXT52670.1 MAG: hypothetical protein FD140_590 [Limisphaerales bacterium]